MCYYRCGDFAVGVRLSPQVPSCYFRCAVVTVSVKLSL